ncbi:DNA alkylation repair protein [Demequina flava]|uniref:DNA alkylation repair protein n=1 Tax=Demequina flava TaxID=1095025 RepID=UPI000783CE3B|nr:DNA alkylation repair protein [Demequina flava]
MSDATVPEVLDELAALHDPKILAVNERHGDDHAVNLTKLRAIAKRIKTDQDLALELWHTGDTEARLVALLICRPKQFTEGDLDSMLRDAQRPKVRDWLLGYVVAKSAHMEALRVLWFHDADTHVQAAGWALTALRLRKRNSEGLDLTALLDQIETQMKDAPADLQWEMNNALAYIGIEHEDRRKRALTIGENLEVLKDYPTPPNCTSPYAPIWINEMVSRQS